MKPSEIAVFHTALARWYKTHGRRDLPWRTTANPYHIWVSEVMLQQTQVKTVLERYYFPFLKAFPTIEVLAHAPREKVLKAWEGLGYYSRARNLHAAARVVTSHQSPAISATFSLATGDWRLATNALCALPGIGRNTAHAILAFAYHAPLPVLEANVKRVIARLFALKTPKEETLWEKAEQLLNRKHPFDYNQAMMDLGALVCTPKAPRCGECPAHTLCKGKADPLAYPQKKAKKSTPTRHVIVEVMEDAAGRFYLESRGDRLLGGLYGFPQHTGHDSRSTIPNVLGAVTHAYSHFTLVGDVHHTKLATRKNSADWHTREELRQLPLSRLDHKILTLIDNQHSAEKKTRKNTQGKRRAA